MPEKAGNPAVQRVIVIESRAERSRECIASLTLTAAFCLALIPLSNRLNRHDSCPRIPADHAGHMAGLRYAECKGGSITCRLSIVSIYALTLVSRWK